MKSSIWLIPRLGCALIGAVGSYLILALLLGPWLSGLVVFAQSLLFIDMELRPSTSAQDSPFAKALLAACIGGVSWIIAMLFCVLLHQLYSRITGSGELVLIGGLVLWVIGAIAPPFLGALGLNLVLGEKNANKRLN